MKKLLSLTVLAAFLACLGAVANARQKTDLSGTWTGYAERQGSQDGLTLVLEKKDATYSGKLTDEMGMFPGAEIKNFVQKAETITFEFDGGMGGQVFTLKAELKLSGETMKGTWAMVGVDDSGTMELVRKK
jgi:hypothetical protein